MTGAKKVLEAARIIMACGFRISLSTWNGIIVDISPEEVVEIVDDKDGWLSKQYGITRDRYVQWRIYMEDHNQCTAITRAGKRCKNMGIPYPEPEEFMPGFHDRCFIHRE